MKMARSFLSVLCVGITLILLASCQGKKEALPKQERKLKQEIRINIVGEPQALDPRKVRSLADINLTKSLMEGLMRVNQQGEIAPAIAESYTLSPDMKTYTFSLRNSYWSNGDPLSANDFIYAWKKALSPDFATDYAFLLYAVKNAKAIKEGTLPVSFLGVSAKDDLTLVVELERPTSFFLDLLALPVFFPVNKEVDLKTPDWHRNAATYVSNGPFKMTEWAHTDHITAVKNELYWDAQAVQLGKIEMVMVSPDTGFKMFQNGELDWEGSPFSNIPTDAIPTLKEQNLVLSDPLLGTYWIRANTNLFPLHSEHLRKALSLAMNRKDIVEHVTGVGLPSTGIVPISMKLQKEPYFMDNNMKEATEALHLALEKEGLQEGSLPEICISYTTSSAYNHRVAQALQAQWQKTLHIDVRLEPLEPKIYFDRVSKGDYQLALGSWIADYRDPMNFLEVFKTKNLGTNNTGWENPEYQKALEASYLTSTPEERFSCLRQAEEIIVKASPVIPIFQFTMLHVQNPKLQDVLLTDAGHLDFKWAHISDAR